MSNNHPSEREHNLLVVDDEEPILRSLKRQFRKDYNVFMANSAEEGLEIMKEHVIHVIISDQRMPGMEGSVFFDQVKHEFPDAIRLLLTGYADIEAVIEAINQGNIFRYITKPWYPIELDTIVRDAFERHDLIVENRQLVSKLKEANTGLEKRVEERTAELRALNHQKDRMIGVVAHDLRGPLGSIRMCQDVLSDDDIDAATKSEFRGVIEEIIEKALLLIDDLLDVSAIETGQLVLDKDRVQLDQFLKKVIRLNKPQGDRKNIVLDLCYERPAEWVFDPNRVDQVLDNLISNAFKYSHRNTTVRLEVGEAEGALCFKVLDKGQGIREEDMQKLFTAFQKTGTLPTGEEQSNGLGLSICKRIVETHGGSIEAKSVFGEGSCFSFYLP